jgi:hypothetical protein
MKQLISLIGLTLFVLTASAQVPVTTQHNDNFRTGANTGETRITVASLKSRGMVRKYQIPVGAGVETQVLYVPNVPSGGTNHNVAYVTTVGNQILAIDTDTGSQLWPPVSLPFPTVILAASTQRL